jgi:hypothetical protein
MSTVKDRDALYYPYFHIRDLEWLKATLLTFPHLHRMVPPEFEIKDDPKVDEFRRTIGAGDRELVIKEDLTTQEVIDAQDFFKSKLEAEDPSFLRAFTKTYAGNDESFQVRRDRFIITAGEAYRTSLLPFLIDRKLAWKPRTPVGPDPDWYVLHPRLGEILMGMTAVQIATQKGLDIVTNKDTIHYAIATRDMKAVYDSLLKRQLPSSSSLQFDRSADKAHSLTHVVMLENFDLSQLSVKDIVSLSRDSSRRELKQALMEIAKTIEEIPVPSERAAKLKESSEQVIQNWNEYKLTLTKFARTLTRDAPKGTKALLEKLAPAIGGASLTATLLGAAPGLVIGLLTYAGMSWYHLYREELNSPYRYLTDIVKAGAILAVASKPKPEPHVARPD